MIIIKRLKEYRRDQKIPQQEVARRIGVAPITLNRNEKGKTRMYLDTAESYAREIGYRLVLIPEDLLK